MDLLLLQFYCNYNSDDRRSHKQNTTTVQYVDMSLHYTRYLFCIMA
jgi:hypothetical protein